MNTMYFARIILDLAALQSQAHLFRHASNRRSPPTPMYRKDIATSSTPNTCKTMKLDIEKQFSGEVP